MVSAPVVRDRNSAFCDERLELQAVLSSPLFQRAPKLSKILAYVCEQYFTGKAADLKEYSIAVDALGRAPGFDPQADAIVRVDLHLLRKRLELFYAQDGKNRRVRIILPLGHLVYSAHDYGPNLFAQSWFNGSTTLSSLEAVWTKFWAYISANNTAPVWIGEFGTDNNNIDIENTAAGSEGQWFESLVTFFQNNPNLSWTYLGTEWGGQLCAS